MQKININSKLNKMKTKKVIVFKKDKNVEHWLTLTDLCRHKREGKAFGYDYLKLLKFPFIYKGCEFSKIELKKGETITNYQGKGINIKI